MKIWHSYGTEHSMNLVMIGNFETAQDAAKAKRIIDELGSLTSESQDRGELEAGEDPGRYPESISAFMRNNNVWLIGPGELQQFLFEVHIKEEGDKIVITTDESDVSAFLKILVDCGARVEVYSAHQYGGTGYGRNTASEA